MIEFTIHAIDPDRRRVEVTFHLDIPLRVRGANGIEEERIDQRSNIRELDCDWSNEQDIVRAIREYALANYTAKTKRAYNIVGKRLN